MQIEKSRSLIAGVPSLTSSSQVNELVIEPRNTPPDQVTGEEAIQKTNDTSQQSNPVTGEKLTQQ